MFSLNAYFISNVRYGSCGLQQSAVEKLRKLLPAASRNLSARNGRFETVSAERDSYINSKRVVCASSVLRRRAKVVDGSQKRQFNKCVCDQAPDGVRV